MPFSGGGGGGTATSPCPTTSMPNRFQTNPGPLVSGIGPKRRTLAEEGGGEFGWVCSSPSTTHRSDQLLSIMELPSKGSQQRTKRPSSCTVRNSGASSGAINSTLITAAQHAKTRFGDPQNPLSREMPENLGNSGFPVEENSNAEQKANPGRFWGSRKSATRMTGRRSHWTERGDDNIFHVCPLWCTCSFSGCEWASCHGTLLCELSIPKCGGVLGGNDQNRAEKQNVVLTWFRPVTWSSGHLGR